MAVRSILIKIDVQAIQGSKILFLYTMPYLTCTLENSREQIGRRVGVLRKIDNDDALE